MENQTMERKAMAIIGIVLGGLGLLLSWMPIINNFAFLLAIVGLILTAIALFRNKKRTKTLTWVSLGLSVATIVIVLVTQASYGKALDNISDAVKTETTAEADKNLSTNKTADWTIEDYEALVVGDTLTGVGGTDLAELTDKFGKPSTTSESSIMDQKVKHVSWSKIKADGIGTVSLTFAQQEDGSWKLSSKSTMTV